MSMGGICEQCSEYITEMDHCLCTHAIHRVPELSCPWCGLDEYERAEVLQELQLGDEWEVVWLGHNYPAHRHGCGPVYGLITGRRSFGHCMGCDSEVPFTRGS